MGSWASWDCPQPPPSARTSLKMTLGGDPARSWTGLTDVLHVFPKKCRYVMSKSVTRRWQRDSEGDSNTPLGQGYDGPAMSKDGQTGGQAGGHRQMDTFSDPPHTCSDPGATAEPLPPTPPARIRLHFWPFAKFPHQMSWGPGFTPPGGSVCQKSRQRVPQKGQRRPSVHPLSCPTPFSAEPASL